jgi:hypothetical protein
MNVIVVLIIDIIRLWRRVLPVIDKLVARQRIVTRAKCPLPCLVLRRCGLDVLPVVNSAVTRTKVALFLDAATSTSNSP